jgi:spermidine synthase
VEWYFSFFFVSGFCSVLCELIWLRLSMAQFGVTTALTSIVLSVFMAGLGAGSWFAGALLHRYRDRIAFSPLRLYALLEFLIGVSALVVPAELVWGHRLLETLADRAAVSSAAYYLISGLWLSATMIPFCACMGATIPVAMFAIRKRQQESDHRSFSFLYLANVLGAMLGSFLPLLLIEPYGFHKTLLIGAALNVAIAVSALVLSLASRPVRRRTAISAEANPPEANPSEASPSQSWGAIDSDRSMLVLLFTTGLATMGMELIWIRLFTPYVGPVVYSFWHNPGRLPFGDVCGLANLPPLEPHPSAREPANMDIAGATGNAAAAYGGRSHTSAPLGAGLPGHRAVRGNDGFPHAHAGRPLVRRRSRPGRSRLRC